MCCNIYYGYGAESLLLQLLDVEDYGKLIERTSSDFNQRDHQILWSIMNHADDADPFYGRPEVKKIALSYGEFRILADQILSDNDRGTRQVSYEKWLEIFFAA